MTPAELDAIEQRASHLIGLTIAQPNATRIAFDMAETLARVPELVAEVRRLREALREYGDHHWTACALVGSKCECGYSKALEGER